METPQWLENKLADYKDNPAETLELMLANTTDIIQQFQNSPQSLAAKGCLEACLLHNKLFLDAIKEMTTA